MTTRKQNSGLKLALKTSVVSGMTLISRILGLVRDVVFARFFGASLVMDAFLVAQRIPNMLRRFFAEGAFSASTTMRRPVSSSTRSAALSALFSFLSRCWESLLRRCSC